MKAWLFAAAVLAPIAAHAAPIYVTGTPSSVATTSSQTKGTSAKGGSLGTAKAGDIVLGGLPASRLLYLSGYNPQQGSSGNASGFTPAYAASGTGNWSGIGKFTSSNNVGQAQAQLAELPLVLNFALDDTRHGTWTVTNNSTTQSLELDLVFAMHTGGGAGAWLFDDLSLDAGQTLAGTWSLNLFNHGGKLADYSNLTLFARDAVAAVMAQQPDAANGSTTGSLIPAAPVVEQPPASQTAPANASGGSQLQLPVPQPASSESEQQPPFTQLLPGSANGQSTQQTPQPLPGTENGGFVPLPTPVVLPEMEGEYNAQVPVPGTLVLFLAGLGLLVWTQRALARRANPGVVRAG